MTTDKKPTKTDKTARRMGRTIAERTVRAIAKSEGPHAEWIGLIALGRGCAFDAGSAITPKRLPRYAYPAYSIAADGFWDALTLAAAVALGAALRGIVAPTPEEERAARAKRDKAMGEAMAAMARRSA